MPELSRVYGGSTTETRASTCRGRLDACGERKSIEQQRDIHLEFAGNLCVENRGRVECNGWRLLDSAPKSSSAPAPTFSLRKEVIQPQVLLRLPCYDFTPITSHTLDGYLLAVESPASSTAGFRDVTGGVYKARERIHRGMLIRDY